MVKIIGAISAVLLSLIFIVLVIMVTRPAILVGVSGGTLATSVSGGNEGSEEGTCNKRPDGTWRCQVQGPDANGPQLAVVNWMGCWTAVPVRDQPELSSPEPRKGCIELSDIITFD